jgi:hypothetical protein
MAIRKNKMVCSRVWITHLMIVVGLITFGVLAVSGNAHLAAPDPLIRCRMSGKQFKLQSSLMFEHQRPIDDGRSRRFRTKEKLVFSGR